MYGTNKTSFGRLHHVSFSILPSDLDDLYKHTNNDGFENLFQKDNSITLHKSNFQNLATKVFKFSNRFSPPIMWELLEEKCIEYNLNKNLLHSVKPMGHFSAMLQRQSFVE